MSLKHGRLTLPKDNGLDEFALLLALGVGRTAR
jgi:hypothetical protein